MTKESGAINLIGSGATSLLTAFTSLQAASAQAEQFKIQRTFDDLAASQERLKARENAIFLRKKYSSNIASGTTALAARNVSAGSGVGRQFIIESLKNLGEDLQANELSSSAIQNSLNLRSSQTRLSEQTTRNLGRLQALEPTFRGSSNLLTGVRTLIPAKPAVDQIKTEGKNA
jgi:hypothetical protein